MSQLPITVSSAGRCSAHGLNDSPVLEAHSERMAVRAIATSEPVPAERCVSEAVNLARRAKEALHIRHQHSLWQMVLPGIFDHPQPSVVEAAEVQSDSPRDD